MRQKAYQTPHSSSSMDGCAGHRLPDTANPTTHTPACLLLPRARSTSDNRSQYSVWSCANFLWHNFWRPLAGRGWHKRLAWLIVLALSCATCGTDSQTHFTRGAVGGVRSRKPRHMSTPKIPAKCSQHLWLPRPRTHTHMHKYSQRWWRRFWVSPVWYCCCNARFSIICCVKLNQICLCS